MRQLKPDNVVAKLYTSDFTKLERELHQRYKKFRIPQTEYFRLKNTHLKEINQIFTNIEYPISIMFLGFLKLFLFLILIFILVFILLFLNINDISIVLFRSTLWMERISYFCSFLSLFLHSGYYFNYLNEFRYRFTRLFTFSIFGFFFGIASVLLQ